MAFYYEQESRTFNEYLLVPGYSSAECVSSNVSLKVPLVKFARGEKPKLELNVPLVSAIMQSVSDDKMATALAREGGISFVFVSQSIESQAAMIRRAKNYKAGFVQSMLNVHPKQTLADILELKQKTGRATVAVTEDGTNAGKLVGLVTSKDYRVTRMPPETPVAEFMTPHEKLICAKEGTTLSKCNDIIWDNKLNVLPIIDDNGRLTAFVFRKDYDSHKENQLSLFDDSKRYLVGAGVNTHDYEQRIPALVEAGADVLCIDSSEGFSEWQKRVLSFVREKYGNTVKIGAGNVVCREGFRYLAENGADFIKVGIGGGAICITREAKGIGRGQATSIMDVAAARNEYFQETGIYVPICSDGGIVHDYHITLALAMGADFCMQGRYFARFDESPTKRVNIGGNYMKEYWGEGTERARNWQRYEGGGGLTFEEGVDAYVPYAGSLRDNLNITLSKIKAAMCNCGALTISEFQDKARLTRVSPSSILEGGAHDVYLKDSGIPSRA
ncbi:MAG: IMP dehydrogenase [Defluviitaleaceae bacterium]|nr:IMP dehydrogenase [Defluviitaleaceae bacterium]MCL2264264.1 IMP dehydrogenase [Defluviitaleaceae bacterium]